MKSTVEALHMLVCLQTAKPLEKTEIKSNQGLNKSFDLLFLEDSQSELHDQGK